MALIVHKYGGTSVANSELIKHIARRVVKTKHNGNDVVVVVSAQAGVTDSLLQKAQEVIKCPAGRELDILLATGEQITIALLAMAIQDLGEEAISFTGTQAGIYTNNSYNSAKIEGIDIAHLQRALAMKNIAIVAGFQGITNEKEITTLGRGGSDITAVALGVALGAKEVDIYTDVDGIYTADPRVVANATKIPIICFEEMLELAASGAKVLHTRSVELAAKHSMPINLKSSFNENGGTKVQEEVKNMEQAVVRGIAHTKDIAKIIIHQLNDFHSSVVNILNNIAEAHINIKLFNQNFISAKENNLTLIVSIEDYQRTLEIIEASQQSHSIGPIILEKDVARVSVIGYGMKSNAGVAAKVIKTLNSHAINVNMVSCSEINISCIIAEDKCHAAVQYLHNAFQLEQEKQHSKGKNND